MRSKEIILNNLTKYTNEINSKFNSLSNLRQLNPKDNEYFDVAFNEVERLYSLLHDLEDALSINQLRSKTYSYSVSVKGLDNEIFLPVGNATSILYSFQRSLRIFNKNAKLNLVNVLRGSTILCFDYSEEIYNQKAFNRENLSQNFSQLAEILNEPEKSVEKELGIFFKNDKQKTVQAVKAFKGLTPIPGSDISININTEFGNFDPIIINEEVRKTVNLVVPTKAPKDIRVNWEDKIAIGYIREINNVTRSFILFENKTDNNEATSMIKLHYDSLEIEKAVLELFRKKAKIEFEKEAGKNRYHVVRINPN